MKKEKKLLKNYKGFTLLEMLVVVLIIGILAGIALPQYRKAVIKARLAEADIAINTMMKNIDLYLLANGGEEGGMLTGGDPRIPSEIEIPGDCNDGQYCRTDYFGFYADCLSSTFCEVVFDTNEAKSNNTWLNGAFVVITKNDDHPNWRIEAVEPSSDESTKKILCEWAKKYPDPNGVCD